MRRLRGDDLEGEVGRRSLGLGLSRRGRSVGDSLLRIGLVEDGAVVTAAEGTDGLLEDDALVVALTEPLRFDAVVARRLGLIALYAALAAGWSTSGGSRPGKPRSASTY